MAGDALTEPEAAEDAQRAGELLLAVEALLLDGGERRRAGELDVLRRERDPVDRRGVGGIPLAGVVLARDLLDECHGARLLLVGRRTDGSGDDRGMNRAVMPPSIAPPAASYAHAVLSDGPAGCCTRRASCPIAPDGSVPADVAAQAGVVWANIGAILAAAEMAIGDIVSVTTYVVVGEELGPVMAARDARVRRPRRRLDAGDRPGARPSGVAVEVAVVAAAFCPS